MSIQEQENIRQDASPSKVPLDLVFEAAERWPGSGGTVMFPGSVRDLTDITRAVLRANDPAPSWVPSLFHETVRRINDERIIKPSRIEAESADASRALEGGSIDAMPGLRPSDGITAMTFRTGFPTEWRRCLLPKFG